MSSSTHDSTKKSGSPQKSPMLHELIPVFAEKHPTFRQLWEYFAKQDQSNTKSAIDQDNGIVSLARSLFVAACLTGGSQDDYEHLVAHQSYDRLTHDTFKRLSGYFEPFATNHELYHLFELYIIISHFCDTEIVNNLIRRIPKDKLDYSKFGLPYALIDNGLIPEANELNLAQFNTLRKAFEYAAKVEQAGKKKERITFNRDFSESEQRIVYDATICDLAALIGPINVSGSLTLTESLASDLLLMLYYRNDPEYIWHLCSLSQS